MPVVSPPIAIDRPRSGQGGGVHPPAYGGGGDNGPGDGSPDYSRRLNRARLGLLFALAPISMLFVTFTAIYLLRHVAQVFDSRTHTYVREWVRVTLPVRLLLVNTFVLLLSSLTIEMARRAAAREMALAPVRNIPGIALGRERGVPWLAITVALGLLFLGGQWMAWEALGANGFRLATSASTSFVYILTGSHALHLAGGIIVLLYAGIIALLHHPIEQRRIVIEIAARYWHFMSVLWAYIFALLQFAR